VVESKKIEEGKEYKYLGYISKEWRTGKSYSGKNSEGSDNNGAGMRDRKEEIWRKLEEKGVDV